jgi:hypothetical protein
MNKMHYCISRNLICRNAKDTGHNGKGIPKILFILGLLWYKYDFYRRNKIICLVIILALKVNTAMPWNAVP